MTTKTKYLVIALLLLVLVTTSVGLSTWNIHYQAVIGDIAYDTSSMEHSFLDEYIYFGSTTNGNATANKGLCDYPIGYKVNDDGNLVGYQVNQQKVFTFTYQSGLSYTPTVFVPSESAIKGQLPYDADLFLGKSALDIDWGIKDVFGEIAFEYQYRKVAMPFVADYKGNSDNYCEINAVYYAENQISVYLTWKNGNKGNHQGTNVLVGLRVNDDGTPTTTIEGVSEQIAKKISVNYNSGIVTIGVNGFSSYELNMTNQGWTTDVPDSVGVYQCRISAKLDVDTKAKLDAYNALSDEKKAIIAEALELLNEKTENDVKYATQVTYAVIPKPVSRENTVTDYNDGKEKLQAKRSGTTRGTMPLAEENQQTQEAADKYVFTLGTGDAAISGTSFVYKGQDYNIKIEAYFQPTEGADVISINYAEDQENDAKDIVRHEDITSIDDHVYSTYGFSSDPNYIVTNPAVHYTIIKQEVKLTGWNGLKTTYNGDKQEVEPILENTHGEVTFSVSYLHQSSGGNVAKNAGIYTVTASLVDAEENSGHSSNFFLANYASNGNSTEKTDLTATFTINKASLTVTAKNLAVIYGNEITYESTCTGFVKDEGVGNLAGEIKYNSGYKRYDNISNWDDTLNKGVYTIKASGYKDKDEEGNTIYADDGNHNYTFTYDDGTLTVEKAKITDISIVGHTGTYDGAQHYFSATATTVNSQEITVKFYKGENDQGNVVTFVKDVADSGKYFCKISAPNHYDATSTFTVEITPASVKVVVYDQEITYGDAAPKYTVTYTGLFGEDTFGTSPVCQYKKGDNAGTYPITLTGVVNGNYTYADDSVVSGTLTVNKATTSITGLTIAGWTYGEYDEETNKPYATTNFGTIKYWYKLTSAADSTYTETVPTNAGNYTVKAEVVGNNNYTSDTETATFTINPASIENAEITLDKTSLVYTGSEQTVSVTKVVLGGKELSASDYTVSDTSGTNADKYPVTVTGQGNYTGSATTTFTIARKPIDKPVIIDNDKAFTFNGVSQRTEILANITYDPNTMVISGEDDNTFKTYGVKNIKFTPNSNHCWQDETTDVVNIRISIGQLKVRVNQQLLDYSYADYNSGITWDLIAKNVVATTPVADGTVLISKIEYTVSANGKLDELKGNIIVGNTYKIVYTPISSVAFEGNSYCYLKYKTAKVGSTYYTIEDAIANVGTGTITMIGDASTAASNRTTSFTGLTGISGITGLENYTGTYTLSGSKLLIPYENSTNNFTTNKNAKSGNVYAVLTMPSNVTLNLTNGASLVAGAVIGYDQNVSTTLPCNRGVFMNDGTINVASGCSVSSYGYIKSSSKDSTGIINVENGATLLDCMHVNDWPGGTAALAIVSSVFPTNAWSLHGVSCITKFASGSTYKAYVHVVASIVGSQTATATIIGNSSTTSNCMFRPAAVSQDNYIIKRTAPADKWTTGKEEGYVALYSPTGHNYIAGQRDVIEVHGTYSDSTLSISAGATLKTSTSISLPLGFMDITVSDGTTLNLSACDYMLLPGSTILIEPNATVNLGSGVDLAIMDWEYYLNTIAPQNTSSGPRSFSLYCVDTKDAELIVNGTLNVSGSIGGNISSSVAGGFINMAGGLNAGFTTLIGTGEPRYVKVQSGSGPDAIARINKDGQISDPATFESGTYVSVGENINDIYWTAAGGYSNYTIEKIVDGKSTKQTIYYSGAAPSIDSSSLGVATKDYYTFVGWYTDETYETLFSADPVENGITYTVYAKFTPIEYNVTYVVYGDELGGDNILPTTEYTNESSTKYSAESKLVLRAATSGEKVFSGWHLYNPLTETYVQLTDDLSTGALEVGYAGDEIGGYTLGDIIELTLYATLITIPEYTVNYYAQIGDNTEPILIKTEVLLEGKVIKSVTDLLGDDYNNNADCNYYFIDDWWYTDATFSNHLLEETEAVDSNLNLYAKRADKKNIVVTYNYNYTGAPAETTESSIVIPGNNFNVTLETPSRTGWTFLGWSKAVSGGDIVGNEGQYSTQESVTLYAQWEKTPYTITVTTNNATVNGVTNKQTAYYGDTITFTVSYSGDRSQSTTVTDANGNPVTTTGSYTFTMPASDVTINATSSGTCVSPNTLITLADGTVKPISMLDGTEQILSWNPKTNKFEADTIAAIWNHGEQEYTVIRMYFSNGALVENISTHAFYNISLNQYVEIDGNNAHEFIGQEFAIFTANGMSTAVLESVKVTREIIGCYSLMSKNNNNFISNGIVSRTPDPFEGFFQIFEEMFADQEQLQKDIETYGLYTYEEWAPYISKEDFDAFYAPYFKILVGKGIITEDEIFKLIDLYATN